MSGIKGRLFAAFLFAMTRFSFAPYAIAESVPDLTGTWFGDFVLTPANGKSQHDTAVFILAQKGPSLTGSAGRSVDDQTPFSNGEVSDNRVSFHLNAAGGMHFDLRLDNGHLRGAAKSDAPDGFSADIDVQPAPELAPHALLEQEILAADHQAFSAFEACDVAQYAAMLDDGLEFYQDRTGKTDYAQNVEALKNRCTEGIQLRRELVPGSVIVNPVPGYGVIEAGMQRFFSKQKDGSEHLDATARFVTIWRKTTGTWKMTRIVSYDHR